MSVAAVVEIGTMLLSAVRSAGIHSVMLMIMIAGAIPVLAIATVCAIEGGVKRRSAWPGVRPGGELRNLAAAAGKSSSPTNGGAVKIPVTSACP